ncbi:MAG TPA: SDR family oxidoreductase [Dehalococcoidia bacterium]|nr:SDR family oxidoreductase [Dehalococcoidia bacterium]
MNETKLDGKIAIVTGAGSDIGLGWNMTQALLEAGARVALVDVDSTALEARSAEARRISGAEGGFTTITADVTSYADGTRAVATAVERLGGLHILVNNAGINLAAGASFWDLDPQHWLRTIATNLTGPFLMARAAVEHMRAQRWGRIIGVTTSFDTMLRAAPYGPAKAGHEALIAVMARELEGSGVTANVLVPGGATLTNMTAGRRDATGLLRPEVMQKPVIWLASADSDGFNGRRIIGKFWDDALPIAQRLEKASWPVAWPELERLASSQR